MFFEPPNIPVQISANPGMSDFINDLNYPITIKGITVANSETSAEIRPKFVIARSMTSKLQSKCLSNIYLCNVLIIILLFYF